MCFNATQETDKSIVTSILNYTIIDFFEKNCDERSLDLIHTLYNKLKDFRFLYRYPVSKKTIPIELAELIMQNCKKYPKILTNSAENTCRFIANKNAIAIGKIAIDDNWFKDTEH